MIKELLPIGTIVRYRNLEVEIVAYSDINNSKNYVIQPVGESAYYQRIVRYDHPNLEEIK